MPVAASPSEGLPPRGVAAELWRGLVVQAEVVHAIILRETRTRFGAYRIGYLWAIADPVIVILTFFGFFQLVSRPAPPGMDMFTFLATGLITYRLFSSCAQQVGEAINGNRALLFYPRVLPIDLAVARWIFELVTYSSVFLVLMGCHALYFQQLNIDSPLLVIAGFMLASLLGTSVGLVFCSLGVLWQSVDRARGALLRPFFWISGVFFTVAMLPVDVQPLAQLNPVVHATELVRAGWFPRYGAEYADPVYLIRWILGFTLAGLILERVVRRRIELT